MLFQKPRIPVKDVLFVGLLPGFLKKLVYRLKGYRIGKGVSIGFGSVIKGEDVSIGDNSSIGFLTIVRGRKIAIGEFVSIGSTAFIDTPHIEIGDGTKINEQVFVGGLQFPDSKFVVGRNCQIMQMTFINPTRSVIIGDDSGIGGHCLIFGHTSWLSIFEGYPVDFRPVEIGKSVSIAWGAFLLPGTRVGDGAVVGAHSVVHRTVPPRCLAVGFPAQVVSKFPDFPKDVTEEQKVGFLRMIIEGMAEFFRGSGLICEMDGDVMKVSRSAGRGWRMNVAYDPIADQSASGDRCDVFLSLRSIPPSERKALRARGTMWIDIESKEQSYAGNDLGDEVVLFLRRYGVRFFRVKD